MHETLLHGASTRRVWTLRATLNEFRTPEFVHRVEGFYGNRNFSRAAVIVA